MKELLIRLSIDDPRPEAHQWCRVVERMLEPHAAQIMEAARRAVLDGSSTLRLVVNRDGHIVSEVKP